jgi:hypothetical protein
MLHKKIAEARRAKRPNVPLMWKNLEGMKKQARLGGESVRILTIEDACIKAVLIARTNALAAEVLEKFTIQVEELREKVKNAKQMATRRWSPPAEGVSHKLASLSRFQIEAFESLNTRIEARNKAIADTKFQLGSHITRMQRTLVANKMEMPEGFFRGILLQ